MNYIQRRTQLQRRLPLMRQPRCDNHSGGDDLPDARDHFLNQLSRFLRPKRQERFRSMVELPPHWDALVNKALSSARAICRHPHLIANRRRLASQLRRQFHFGLQQDGCGRHHRAHLTGNARPDSQLTTSIALERLAARGLNGGATTRRDFGINQ
jgi:hypothetical protein